MTVLRPTVNEEAGRKAAQYRGEHVLSWREGGLPLSMSSGRAGARVFWAIAVLLLKGYKATSTGKGDSLLPLLESLAQVTGCKVQVRQPLPSQTRWTFIYTLSLLVNQVYFIKN